MMAMGLEAPRASRRRVCDGRVGTSRPTIREVCLLGMGGCPRGERWTIGQMVTWLGRGYRVVATPPQDAAVASGSNQRGSSGSRIGVASAPAEGRRYVHLAPCSEG
jgi:hypothetical protein